jgi:hypothetical protein
VEIHPSVGAVNDSKGSIEFLEAGASDCMERRARPDLVMGTKAAKSMRLWNGTSITISYPADCQRSAKYRDPVYCSGSGHGGRPCLSRGSSTSLGVATCDDEMEIRGCTRSGRYDVIEIQIHAGCCRLWQ